MPNTLAVSLVQQLQELRRDRTGSTYALLAAAIVPLAGMVGFGLDLGRAYTVDARLQGAVDAAVLAGVRAEQLNPGTGSTLGPSTLSTVNSFLTANIPTDYGGSSRQTPELNLVRDGEEVRLTLTVRGTVRTTLMNVFGIATLPVVAVAEGIAGRTLPTAVETMFVLDNTGSMDSNNGMVSLRAATRAFLDVVYGNNQTRENFAVGMLPYNVIANVGRLLPSHMVEQVSGFTDLPASDANGWKGCVLADPTIRDLSSDVETIDTNTFDMGRNLPGENGMPRIRPSIYPPLTVRSFHRQHNMYKLGTTTANAISVANYAPMRTALIRHYGNDICRIGSNPALCTAAGAQIDPTRLPNYASWPNARLYSSTVRPSNADDFVSASPNYVCPSEALPVSYSRTKAELISYIDVQNQPLFNIGTWHTPGLVWGYRLLAREDVFTRARPADKPVRRVMIFMSDGNFDSNDQGDTRTTRTPNFLRDTAYTAYSSYADQLVTTTDTVDSHRQAQALRFSKTCQAMKREGIEIYAITFAIASGAVGNQTRAMFQNCATNRNTHFFETQNTNDLRAAFVTIAADLVDLHLAR
jgi:Flp pilus assembly protein TadG